MILYSLLLIVLMLTRPQGLFGDLQWPSGRRKEESRMSALLELDNVTVQFGGLKAVSELSLEIHEGELIGLIGPNGAGKTTVFNLITGVYQPTSGAFCSPASRWSGSALKVPPRAASRARFKTSASSLR